MASKKPIKGATEAVRGHVVLTEPGSSFTNNTWPAAAAAAWE